MLLCTLPELLRPCWCVERPVTTRRDDGTTDLGRFNPDFVSFDCGLRSSQPPTRAARSSFIRSTVRPISEFTIRALTKVAKLRRLTSSKASHRRYPSTVQRHRRLQCLVSGVSRRAMDRPRRSSQLPAPRPNTHGHGPRCCRRCHHYEFRNDQSR